MKHHYTDLATALADPEGVAVLGFFYEVGSLQSRTDAADPRTLVELTRPSVLIIAALQQRQPQVRAHRERPPEHQGSQ